MKEDMGGRGASRQSQVAFPLVQVLAKTLGQGSAAQACLASHWGNSRGYSKNLQVVKVSQFHLKREKKILTELCVLPWTETTHVERAFRNANECQKFSNLFPAHIFSHISFPACNNGGTIRIA